MLDCPPMLWSPRKVCRAPAEPDWTPAERETLQLEALARWDHWSAWEKNRRLNRARARAGVALPEVPTYPVSQARRPPCYSPPDEAPRPAPWGTPAPDHREGAERDPAATHT